MRLIISPSDNTLYIDYKTGEGHRYYLLPTEQPIDDLARIFRVSRIAAQRSIAPHVRVYRRPPDVHQPGISAVHILTPEEMESLPQNIRDAVVAYFLAAEARKYAERIWETRRMQMIALFLKGAQVYSLVANRGAIDLDAAARILAEVEIRTAIVRSQSSAFDAIRLSATVPQEGGEKGESVSRPAYWHISALPFSRRPIRVRALNWEIGYGLDEKGGIVTMTASAQSLSWLWRQYKAAEEAEQRAKDASKTLSAVADVYQKNMAIPVNVSPYGLVVIKKMPEATYIPSPRRATISVSWTSQWRKRYG